MDTNLETFIQERYPNKIYCDEETNPYELITRIENNNDKIVYKWFYEKVFCQNYWKTNIIRNGDFINKIKINNMKIQPKRIYLQCSGHLLCDLDITKKEWSFNYDTI